MLPKGRVLRGHGVLKGGNGLQQILSDDHDRRITEHVELGKTIQKKNNAIYLQRLTKRAEKIKKSEELIADQFPINEGDIVRLKNVYRSEMAKKRPKTTQDLTIGRLYGRKSHSSIKSADPNNLDPYNIRAKWSRGLFFVIEIGRVIAFKNRQSDKSKHVFISMKRLSKLGFDPQTPFDRVAMCASDDGFLENICGKDYEPDNKVNMTARIRYRVAKISDEFFEDDVITNGDLNVDQLRQKIKEFRQEQVDKFKDEDDESDPPPNREKRGAIKSILRKKLPIMYHVKNKLSESGVNLRGQNWTMDFDTAKIRNLYRKNIRHVKGTLTLRSS